MCYSVIWEDAFLIVYCPDKYKTQRMCDEAFISNQKNIHVRLLT